MFQRGAKPLSPRRTFFQSEHSLSLMCIPAVVLFLLFVIYPLASGVKISFTDWNGYSQKYHYIGLENYKTMFTDNKFRVALKNTFIYGVVGTILQTIIGFVYALFLNNKFVGRTLTRTIIYMPVMIAHILIGYIWYFMVQYDRGAINDILTLFGMNQIDWMGDPTRAVWMITIINTVSCVGVSMIILLAGLQGISRSFFEAAMIDGASSFQTVRYITIPQLVPAFTTSIILNLISGLKIFGLVIAMTAGGPGYASHSLTTLINWTYFSNQNAGYAATIGLTSFIIIMVISLFTHKLIQKGGGEYN